MAQRTLIAVLIMAAILVLNLFRPYVLIFPELGESFFFALIALEHGVGFFVAATIGGYIARRSMLVPACGLWIGYWIISFALMFAFMPANGSDRTIELLPWSVGGFFLTGVATILGVKLGLLIYIRKLEQPDAA